MRVTVLMENSTPSSRLAARHGLALWVEAAGKRILFDMGPDAAFLTNAEELGVDVATADAAVLSHGHADHGGGLGTYLAVTDARGAHAPVFVRAHAFGMQVLAASARRSGAELSASATDPGYPVRYADLGDLLEEADVLSLHCPLSEATRHIINKENLSRMKQGAFLLNLARGPLLDEEAVAEALKSGRIGGLGVDVVSTEPITRDNPLLSSPRTVITPHIAWASLPARQNIIRILADNIRAWQEGTLRSVVNAQWLAAQR